MKCNRSRQNVNIISVVAQNGQIVNLRQNCLSLNNHNCQRIPPTDEKKHIKDVWGGACWHFCNPKRKNSESVQIPLIHRLLQADEYFFRTTCWTITRWPFWRKENNIFSAVSDSKPRLLKQKGYYPYPCWSAQVQWHQSQTLCKWSNTLDGGAVEVTHAVREKNWNNKSCRTIMTHILN